MRSRSTHVEVLDRRAILRPPGDGPQEEQLLERKFTLEDVSFAQTPLTLEIERRDDLLLNDGVLQVRRVLRDSIDDRIAEGFLLVVPVQPGPQLVGRVLHEAREHMLAR